MLELYFNRSIKKEEEASVGVSFKIKLSAAVLGFQRRTYS
jgi:hypothetical protein